AHYLQATVLAALGRESEALQVVDTLLPVQTRTLGADHPLHTLATRHLRIVLLATLGRQSEALEDIEALLPALSRIRGETHQQVLVAKMIRREALMQLNDLSLTPAPPEPMQSTER